ncbi:putative aldouronate transport system permease protein [Caldicoprobacter guelmensis]|uniref:carbohydrate ABC transporter permease n=1 Tax=Caldicoprobacter guelmensis TaxID=1170224 RepID=UPI00195BF4C5|nr:carbohydrate ABC transporter permease [Caldicoprobacter guelmensis]MBM7582960.1 putative aldouronate transport system permease protein [Caldicoprobacter guelmensis]
MNKDKLFHIVIYILLFLIAMTMIIPLLNIVALSLTKPEGALEFKGWEIIPKGFSLINYKVILSNVMVLKSIFNSLFITGMGTLINILMTTMAAYALTRPSLIGKRFFMTLLIIVMVFEPGLIPEYLVIKKIGLIDNYWSVILYKAVNVYYLIIIMRFFDEIPKSLIEAAEIDGAGHMRILFKVVLPVAKAAIATIGLFYAVYHWNEYFRASIYLNSQSKWPLQVVLRQFVVLDDTTSMIGVNNLLSYSDIARLNYKALQATTIIIAVIPILLLYPLILKYYTKGTLEGGVKD